MFYRINPCSTLNRINVLDRRNFFGQIFEKKNLECEFFFPNVQKCISEFPNEDQHSCEEKKEIIETRFK